MNNSIVASDGGLSHYRAGASDRPAGLSKIGEEVLSIVAIPIAGEAGIIDAESMELERPSDLLPELSFFGDASSKNSQFMVLGGLAVSGHRQREIEDAIADIRERGGIRREFHWRDYRGGQKTSAYQELVRYGFGLIRRRQAALHVIVADFREFDHKREEGQTRDTSINKIYWLLCLHRIARLYGKKRAIHIRLDEGNDSREICAMRLQLCASAYKTHQTRPNCIRTIEPMRSERSGIIQLSDVLVGGIASKMNSNPSETSKGQLAEFIRKTSGRHSWRTETPIDSKFLTIWHYKA